jgi:hypothetical protein
MLTLDELLAMHLTRLASFCQKVAENPRMDDDLRAEATTLVAGWAALRARGQQPPWSDEEMEDRMDDLAVKMAEFLLNL